jgi:hypothetical protein
MDGFFASLPLFSFSDLRCVQNTSPPKQVDWVSLSGVFLLHLGTLQLDYVISCDTKFQRLSAVICLLALRKREPVRTELHVILFSIIRKNLP